MSGLHHLGFDVSTKGAGAVLLDPDGQIVDAWVWASEGTADVFGRFDAIHAWAARFALTIPLPRLRSLSIEAPFSRGPATPDLCRAQGAVMVAFPDEKWGIYAVSTVKRTATTATGIRCVGLGGKVGKEAMAEAFYQYWPNDDPIIAAINAAAPSTGTDRVMGDRFHTAYGDLVDAAWVAETDRQAAINTRSAA